MESIEALAEHYKLLGDKTRLTILSLLKHGELCVCEIVELLEMSQPSISQHLRKLRTSGIVQEERRGQWIYYFLNVEDKPHLREVLKYLPSMEEHLQALPAEACN